MRHATAAAPAAAREPALGPRSIAVLPFRLLGLPEAFAFLRESLTDALISELSRHSGLTVVARGTMLTFGDSSVPPREVAAQLGARFVVDGRLEGRGDGHDRQLLVSVQVADGWHDTQTWADDVLLPLAAWHETAGVVVGRLARALHFELNDLATRTPLDGGDSATQGACALGTRLGAAVRPARRRARPTSRPPRWRSRPGALAPQAGAGRDVPGLLRLARRAVRLERRAAGRADGARAGRQSNAPSNSTRATPTATTCWA